MNPHIRNGLMNTLQAALREASGPYPDKTLIAIEIERAIKILENYKPRRVDFSRFDTSRIYQILSFDDLTPKQRLAYGLSVMLEDAKVKLALMREITELARDAVDSRGEWVKQYMEDTNLEDKCQTSRS